MGIRPSASPPKCRSTNTHAPPWVTTSTSPSWAFAIASRAVSTPRAPSRRARTRRDGDRIRGTRATLRRSRHGCALPTRPRRARAGSARRPRRRRAAWRRARRCGAALEVGRVDGIDHAERGAAATACSRPSSLSGGSAWPCHRPSAFHTDCPCRTSRMRAIRERSRSVSREVVRGRFGPTGPNALESPRGTTMKAALCLEQNEPLSVEDVTPLDPGPA